MHSTKFDRAATIIDYFLDLAQNVAQALAEDLGSGDLTATLIPADRIATARVLVRSPAVLCGIPWFDAVYAAVDPMLKITWRAQDGTTLPAETVVCEIHGRARSIVTGERTALNFLQTLSGTATATARYVQQLAGSRTRLLDTRKTIPGLRRAQKYAVRCGGGFNHRAGLYDGILIKENHLEAAGSINAAIAALRAQGTKVGIEVEVERLDQIEEAIGAGADMLLLDNFSPTDLGEAVRLTAGRVPLEASGGFDYADLPAIGATGVDFVSVGSLTKHVQAADFSMRITPD
jgi:nicotinate-nucleotide pyrophosphorylase (carboxylating)